MVVIEKRRILTFISLVLFWITTIFILYDYSRAYMWNSLISSCHINLIKIVVSDRIYLDSNIIKVCELIIDRSIIKLLNLFLLFLQKCRKKSRKIYFLVHHFQKNTWLTLKKFQSGKKFYDSTKNVLNVKLRTISIFA